MNIYPASRYGDVFAQLIEAAPATEIAAGQANTECYASLQALNIESAFAKKTVLDHDAASACLSGIWLLHNYLDQSHAISQDLHSCTGSFWHGIMHRREPDYGNSAYWFRKVGNHDVFLKLASPDSPFYSEAVEAGMIVEGQWDPFRFIDLCAEVAISPTAQIELCRQITRIEWELLFDYGYRKATESDV